MSYGANWLGFAEIQGCADKASRTTARNLITDYQITRRHNPEDHNLKFHRYVNLTYTYFNCVENSYCRILSY